MQEFLLIGGSHDGKRIMQGVPRNELQIPAMRSVCPGIMSNVMHGGVPESEIEHYILLTLRVNCKSHFVYAIHGMSVDTILEKLIGSYGR